MKYSKFYIKNFKGIEELELDLTKIPSPSIFTFVGLNESGKTTILESINFFRNDTEPEKSFKYIPKKKKANFNDSIIVKAYLELDKEDETELKNFIKENIKFEVLNNSIPSINLMREYKFENSKLKNCNDILEIDLFIKKEGQDPCRLSNEDKEIEEVKKYIQNKMLPKIIYYPNFLFDFPSKIYLEPYSNEDGKQKVYRQILQDILDFLDDGLLLKDHMIDRAKSNNDEDKESLSSLLDKVSASVTKNIFDAWGSMFNKSIRKEIIFQLNKDDKGNFIEVKLKENSEKYNIEERSLGFKWFFTFLLFTEFRKNRIDDPGETLFLLDEPAYNLHSNAQSKLLRTFEKLAKNCKMIYTTHSHYLIEPKWLGGTFIIKNNSLDYENDENFDSRDTEIKAILYKQFVAKSPNDRTYFQPILDKLEYQPSLLEDVPNIVIVEGKSDYYIYKYIQEIILKDNREINFYPGNSADKLEPILRLYLAWGRDFLTLFDSDKGGKNAKMNYLKLLGPDLTDKIFTLDEIDKNWNDFTIESLFTQKERKLIIKNVFGVEEDNKSKFSSAIQQLYLDKSPVILSDETLIKFKIIFDFITGKVS